MERQKSQKKPTKIWDVNVDDIFISKLVKTKNNIKYMVGYLDKVMRLLVLIMPKMSEYIKTFKVIDGDKDQNNKLIPFRIYNEKLLEQYRTI